jgi:hypothetical protein
MGGYGSGRKRVRRSEGSYRKLDIRRLSREGALAAGCDCSVSWPGRRAPLAQLHIKASNGELRFSYGDRAGKGRLREADLTVALVWTSCHYGGRRPWFRCPRGGCGRRVAILYADNDFACRHCRALVYDTQRVAPESRALDRAQRLRVRLGGSVDMTQPFPTRPKGMHFLTYMKHSMRAWSAEDKANAEMRKWLDTLPQFSTHKSSDGT